MKKFFSFMICFCFVLATAFTFVACGNEKVSIDDASDAVEEVQEETTAFSTVLFQEANSSSRTSNEKNIMAALNGGLGTLASMASEVITLDMFNDGEYHAEDGEVITKKGNTYTITYGEHVSKIVAKSEKDSLTLTIDETSSIKYSLSKNYLRIDVNYVEEDYTLKAFAELKEVGNTHYYQLVQIEEETYNVINFKYNFTETENGDEDVVNINSFSIVAENGVTTEPSSIKGLKDYANYATGEGAVTYTAQAN